MRDLWCAWFLDGQKQWNYLLAETQFDFFSNQHSIKVSSAQLWKRQGFNWFHWTWKVEVESICKSDKNLEIDINYLNPE